ncbi:MAG TPA: PAS domain-containing protein [Mucilaginibacter sp.]|jgi:nitrogen fixation/metabolism regulation signal transduction histidine kinase|nr:PAS domain-containing protein [Mucilaginibacter sp.]
MNIKNKIRLGLGMIFIVVLCFGAVSIYFISQLSNGAKVILKNNYQTLSFTRGMRTVLDENKLPLNNTAQFAFNTQLVKQEHNVTEKGEYEATARVRADFGVLQSASASPAQQENAVYDARKALRTIEGLNMTAIVTKTDAAQSSVNNAVVILGIVCCVTFLMLFSFSVNISGFMAEPVIKLTEALSDVTDGNYDHQLNFSKNEELVELAATFNEMTAYLRERENSVLTEDLTEKKRIETIIEQMQDAIIVTDEQQDIAFINTAAQNLFNLGHQKLIGRPAGELAANSSQMRAILENESGEGSFKFEQDGKDALFKFESTEINIPNIASLKFDELNIARVAAGKVYIVRNISEFHEI